MTDERAELIVAKLEVFNRLERKATDAIGWIAFQFGVSREQAEKMIDQAMKHKYHPT